MVLEASLGACASPMFTYEGHTAISIFLYFKALSSTLAILPMLTGQFQQHCDFDNTSLHGLDCSLGMTMVSCNSVYLGRCLQLCPELG